MIFSADELRQINKTLYGKISKGKAAVRDEGLLAVIAGLRTREAQAYDVALKHPFVDGNKRTAFLVLYFDSDHVSNRTINNFIEKHRPWLYLLGNL